MSRKRIFTGYPQMLALACASSPLRVCLRASRRTIGKTRDTCRNLDNRARRSSEDHRDLLAEGRCLGRLASGTRKFRRRCHSHAPPCWKTTSNRTAGLSPPDIWTRLWPLCSREPEPKKPARVSGSRPQQQRINEIDLVVVAERGKDRVRKERVNTRPNLNETKGRVERGKERSR